MILPSCRVHPELSPALFVHTVVYTIVVDNHENDWKAVPKKRKNEYNLVLTELREHKFPRDPPSTDCCLDEISSSHISSEKFGKPDVATTVEKFLTCITYSAVLVVSHSESLVN